MSKLKNWMKLRKEREKYTTLKREPFYDLSKVYLPVDEAEVVVDIGAGNGGYARYLDLKSKYRNLYLLDGNRKTVGLLSQSFENVIEYTAPKPLPFESGSVAHLHCSHMIEHLNPEDLYTLLTEFERVLKPGGSLAVSTPLLWDKFYGDLSHIKPYDPNVLIKYLCEKSVNRSALTISEQFVVKELVYRFTKNKAVNVRSENIVVDAILSVTRQLVLTLGVFGYVRNGYTMVMVKES